MGVIDAIFGTEEPQPNDDGLIDLNEDRGNGGDGSLKSKLKQIACFCGGC